MSIVSRLFPREEKTGASRTNAATSDWIDLSDYSATEKTGEPTATTLIRFAELRALDDLKHFSTFVYDGNILIIDFSKVQGDEILLRRLTNELRKLAADTGGDLAGLGDHHILLTPTGVKVDRRKLSAKEEDAETSEPAPRAGPSAAPPTPTAPPTGAPPRRMNGARK
jgi:hypothetical protein